MLKFTNLVEFFLTNIWILRFRMMTHHKFATRGLVQPNNVSFFTSASLSSQYFSMTKADTSKRFYFADSDVSRPSGANEMSRVEATVLIPQYVIWARTSSEEGGGSGSSPSFCGWDTFRSFICALGTSTWASISWIFNLLFAVWEVEDPAEPESRLLRPRRSGTTFEDRGRIRIRILSKFRFWGGPPVQDLWLGHRRKGFRGRLMLRL